MSVVEQQAEELRVDASRGADGCGHEADAVIVSIVRQILGSFFLGSFLERLGDDDFFYFFPKSSKKFPSRGLPGNLLWDETRRQGGARTGAI